MGIAKILESKTYVVPGKLKVTEMFFEVPKDYSNPKLGSLKIFARSVTKHERPIAPVSDEESQKRNQLPWFVYLQGGPGFGCRTPKSMSITNLVLDKGYKMLFLDQRGTGLSTPITADTLALQGNAQKQADYLKMFRADSIVKDCEAIREALVYDYDAEHKKWSVFGQSFGGFCALTYLSHYPQGLREVFLSGGLPPIGKSAEEVYEATFATVIKRNKSLPGGGKLTVRRFLTIGLLFGGEGGIDTVHNLVLRMRSDLAQFNFFTRPTLSEFEGTVALDDTVLYAVLHEAIYCQGEASNWAAERVGRRLKEFRWVTEASSSVQESPLYFSGEMIFPFLFETYPELEKLREVADIIAQYGAWPDLYDERQLGLNEVPVYSAVFVDDMYVNFGLVQETVKKIKDCKQFITNTMYHDAVRSQSESLMEQLFKLRDESLD